MRVLLFSAADLGAGGETPVRGRLLAAGLHVAGAAVHVVSAGTHSTLTAAGVTSDTLDRSGSCVDQLAAAVDRWQPTVILGLTATAADIVANVGARCGLVTAFDLQAIGLVRIAESIRWLRAVGRADVITSAHPILTTYLRRLVSRRAMSLAGITDVDRVVPAADTGRREHIHVLTDATQQTADSLALLADTIARLSERADTFRFTVRLPVGGDPTSRRPWSHQLPGTARCLDDASDEAMADAFLQTDVVVVPRRWTPTAHLATPQMLLDGMGAGRAIVATNLAAHRWVLEPGHAGLLCRRTPEALATALLECVDTDRRADLGRRARAQAGERFCHRRQGERLLEELDRARARTHATRRPAAPPRPTSLRDRDFVSPPASNRARVLCVGMPESSHTRSWIDLFPAERFEVRLFSTTNKLPPADWRVPCYVAPDDDLIESEDRVNMRQAGVRRRRLRRTALAWVERLHAWRMRQLARRIRRERRDAVAVYGAGQAGAVLIAALREQGVEVATVIDSQPSMWGRRVHGIEVQSLDAALAAGASTFAIGSFAYRAPMARAIVAACGAIGREPRLLMPRVLWGDACVRAVSRWMVRAAYARRRVPTVPPWGTQESRAALASIVTEWQPDIVHTMGLDGRTLFHVTRRAWPIVRRAAWICQIWGGPDLLMARFQDPCDHEWMHALSTCDEIVTDDVETRRIAIEHGVPERQFSPLGTVPGNGGVAVDDLMAGWKGLPSTRRALVWPKAYDCPWSKGLPVLEALVAAWPHLNGPGLHLLATTPEMRLWVRTLPPDMQRHITVHERLPRAEALDLMQSARVMLAPSLSDGMPNVLYEAMACGAVPIVSPIPSITPMVTDREHVLFARNLYVHEITAAIVRAMTDDDLADDIARRNVAHIRRLADRSHVGRAVVERYDDIARARTAAGRTSPVPQAETDSRAVLATGAK